MVIWTTAAEFPGILVAYFLIDAVGRRKAIGVQLSLATVSFLLLSVCTSHLFSMVCLFVTRGLFNGSAQTMIVYTAEVFPTTVRAVGVGMAGSVGRLGAIVTPFVAQVLIHRSFYWVVVAYAVPLVVCVVASLLLRIETNDRLLQNSTDGDPKNGKYQTFQ